MLVNWFGVIYGIQLILFITTLDSCLPTIQIDKARSDVLSSTSRWRVYPTT